MTIPTFTGALTALVTPFRCPPANVGFSPSFQATPASK